MRTLSCLCLLLFSVSSFALNPERLLTQAVSEIWTKDQGLPAGRIGRIIQSHDGYLWLATESGLARFDGITFTIFDSQNTNAFETDAVNEVVEDRQGNLWIGLFRGGLIRYRDGKFTAIKNDAVGESIILLFQDKSGKVWIGSEKNLCYFQNEKFAPFQDSKGTQIKSVTDMAEMPDGTLWLLSKGVIYEFKQNILTQHTEAEFQLDRLAPHPLYADSSGRFWFCSPHGVFHFENRKLNVFRSAEELGDRAKVLFTDHHGAMWMGSFNKGLFRYYNGKLEHFTSVQGLSNDQVTTFLEDREGSIWIGTNGGGLHRFRDGKVVTYSIQEGFPAKFTLAILEDSKNNLWIGTEDKGVVRFANGQFTDFTTAHGLSGNSLYTIVEDPAGILWFGTAGWGLNRFENGKFTAYTKKNGLPGDVVFSVLPTKDSLFIGTENGIAEFKDDHFQPFGPSSIQANLLFQTKDGDVWVSQWAEGVIRWHQGKTITYDQKNGLSEDHVLCAYEDQEGTLWIGTYGGGLNRLKNGKFTSYSRKNGLYQNIVFAIVEDNEGRLWMSSNNGIYGVSKKELNDFADGKIKSIHSVVIGKGDGMKSAECNAGNRSGWKTHDGKLWFATTDGIVMLDPSHIAFNTVVPPINFQDVIADDRHLLAVDSSLPPGTKKMEFHFASLSLVDATKNQFQYFLEGFDSKWSNPSVLRTAYYSNLAPGRYVFRVKGSNNDRIWNSAAASFPFRIEPYFYQTKAFLALVIASILLIFYLLYRLRLRQVHQRFRLILEERSRISREMHDTITQDFSGIILQLEAAELQLQNDSSAGMQSIGQARELARRGLAESRRFITALRPQLLERNRLAPALTELARQMKSDTANIEFSLSGVESRVTPEVENQLLRITQEALTNAKKYSQADSIQIDLKFENTKIVLTIQDNGTGFDSANMPSKGGFGISGMRERAKSIGGKLVLTTTPEKGTTITVEVPK
jgi:signal transduction histidine kinase/ligand-binding sensor domain-containing protein